MEFELPDYSLRLMLPEIFLFLWSLVVILFDLITGRKKGDAVGYLTLAGLLICGGLLSVTGYGRGFGRMFFNEPMALFFKVIFLGAAFMAVGSSFSITRQRIVNHRGEYFGLILMSTVGMMFLASSQELLSLWIGLELTTIPLFILAAFYKDDKLSVEAGIKYFVFGAFSSALLLYGLSFLYGMSATTEIVPMKMNLAAMFIAHGSIGVVPMVALIIIIAGLGFKLALPPFHQWAPDVYEGSPTPIAAFLSVGSKAAGLVAFSKIFVNGLWAFWGREMAPNDWGYLVGILACAAMIYGNVVAIRQTNIKRMLAYSSIAQAGYMMIGMVAVNEWGLEAVSFYMFAYMFANMGAFAIVAVVEDRTGSCQLGTYRGLSQSSPGIAAAMAVFMLSLAGIPPLAGFLAKYKVFAAAVSLASHNELHSWLYWVAGVGLITAVFSLYYYANVIKQMYFSNAASPYSLKPDAPAVAVIAIGLIGVVLFGIYAEPILQFVSDIPSAAGVIPR
ncbi:MAG: NADH-quinone oxidoreductase subunit N [candidate division Zixibacteria bacterium]|nr:NADH-quinone oxidoreductase subunit N [candidate division Zixibacteria bacterium]MDH3935696.1 NADH-quinone oxidoreductase subunit N [candidate division Zixibacteria bacterium]